MKQRTCDKCHNIIPAGRLYYKVCSQQYIDKRLSSVHVGDLCIDCWGVKESEPEDMEDIDVDTGTDSLL